MLKMLCLYGRGGVCVLCLSIFDVCKIYDDVY